MCVCVWVGVVFVRLLRCIWLFITAWTVACQASLSSTISQSLLKFMSFELVMLMISSSVVAFSSCPQSFSASGSFPRSWLFTSGGQNIGDSPSTSVLLMNIQGWFPLGLTGLISLQSKGLSGVFSSTTVQRDQFFGAQPFFYFPAFTSVHDYWKNHSFDYMDLCRQSKVFVIAFLPRRKHHLISWLQLPSTVIWEPKRIPASQAKTVILT